MIFSFWEGQRIPLIQLCQKSLLKHNPNAIILNMSNLRQWVHKGRLPKWWHSPKATWSQRTDWLRIYLLYTYGGLWIDADVIVLTCLESFTHTGHDSVLFGATGDICTSQNVKNWILPSNWMIASKKHGHLMGIALALFPDNPITQAVSYHETGKHLMWKALRQCRKGYTYFHVSPNHCGIRDCDGMWVTTHRLCSDETIKYNLKPKQMIVIVWYLSEMSQEYKSKPMSYWMKADNTIGQFIRRALYLN